MTDYKAMYQRLLKANNKAYREINKLADVMLELMQAQRDAEQIARESKEHDGDKRKDA